MTTRPDRDDADRAAFGSFAGPGAAPPSEEILAAVHDGLAKVPAGSPTSWFEVPRQRTPSPGTTMDRRRTL
ncbi:hypothetical protein ACGIF2_11025 [Cellulomonas sp. P22]|uniref:hypothetical protein n=1 Tax=Cellulomonas sp. P22 TaxID=3373189 RepID=UPI00378801E3